jgi:hypothetical protein
MSLLNIAMNVHVVPSSLFVFKNIVPQLDETKKKPVYCIPTATVSGSSILITSH